ncbi:hypothetical protein CEXT_763711 [Caerostris extrusa]|uniref:Uncharacterized protein n=1 Tax=Caerostris extrusa TaxID=172846 RepID=A0AAV4WAL5_CAEEX|nr:hypothetical protein CEXT_763711 [Caerostris extrusa]
MTDTVKRPSHPQYLGVFKMHGSLITPFRLGITGTPEGDENNRGTVPVTAAAFIYQHVTSALFFLHPSPIPLGSQPLNKLSAGLAVCSEQKRLSFYFVHRALQKRNGGGGREGGRAKGTRFANPSNPFKY